MMHRASAVVVGMIVCLGAGATAQRKPDFSGTWTIDRAKSTGSVAAMSTIVVTQDAKALTVEQKGFPKVVYHLDGTPAKNPQIGHIGEATYTSVWQGEKLVTTIAGAEPGQKETRYLDGGEMVDQSEVGSPVGRLARTLYWKKVR